MKYLITFFPRAGDSEFRVSDVSNIVIEADSEEDAINIFVPMANTDFNIRNFIVSFLLSTYKIGTPFKNENQIKKTIEKLKKRFDKQDICSKDLEDNDCYLFIENNTDDFKFLINAYINADCEYIKICEFQKGKSM